MSLLEDARRLAERGFTPWEDSCHWTCESCGCHVETDEEASTWTGHAPDCPWLAMPRIVAALEAAEWVAADGGCFPDEANDGQTFNRCTFCYWGPSPKYDGGHHEECPYQALVAALEGAPA